MTNSPSVTDSLGGGRSRLLWHFAPPADQEVVSPALLLVPVAAFDRRGARIGYGKGYYDRAMVRLGAANPGLVAIGIAYSAQEVEQVPLEPWDRRLTLIVTEKETVAPKPALR